MAVLLVMNSWGNSEGDEPPFTQWRGNACQNAGRDSTSAGAHVIFGAAAG